LARLTLPQLAATWLPAAGIAIGGAVAPIYMALVWNKANAGSAMLGAISGTLLGLMAWLVTCQAYYGEP
jgi:Na+/proline symporter